MSDLISRAAALDAIDGMKPMQGNMEQLVMKSLCWAAVKTIQPVDAIPVEWLENRLNTLFIEAMGAGALYGDRIGELAKSINEVMKLWQKEQEAK